MWSTMPVVLSTRTAMWAMPVVLSARTAMWSMPVVLTERKMRMILRIKITLQILRCKKERALATLLADGITSTNDPLNIHISSGSRGGPGPPPGPQI